MTTTKKPRCKLTGCGGNVFTIIGFVSRTLRDAKQPDKANEFSAKAMACQSYDAVLQLCVEYVDAR